MNTDDNRLRVGGEPGELMVLSACLRRRVYRKPELVPLEALRDITLGPTLGSLESGNSTVFQRHGKGPQPIDPLQDRLPPLP